MSESLPPGLYLVGTPIGNLEDITLRALRVLRGVDRVLCEDTRETAHLLAHYEIRAPMQSCDEHKEHACAEDAVARIRAGERLALVTDAGLPGISDPGARVAAAVAAAGLLVVPVPGANAALTALVGSGLMAERFLFCGFLPSKAGARRTELERLQTMVAAGAEPLVLVLYEAPHRILEMLEDVAGVWGAECRVVLARELTKLHEEFLRGGATDVRAQLAERERVRGEMVVLVEAGASVSSNAGKESIVALVERLMKDDGLSEKDALKRAARERGLGKSEVYREWQRAR
ncbi:MAG TPA: 16S rRNA (cytidine(1402)-2'-O)-methyltransferase [Acidobacteriaceae bacterium]|nr:16S rRNA (cytidine(1402)-2'-O)-methyltransferase [Acidobacteriaceae bacterium]